MDTYLINRRLQLVLRTQIASVCQGSILSSFLKYLFHRFEPFKKWQASLELGNIAKVRLSLASLKYLRTLTFSSQSGLKRNCSLLINSDSAQNASIGIKLFFIDKKKKSNCLSLSNCTYLFRRFKA